MGPMGLRDLGTGWSNWGRLSAHLKHLEVGRRAKCSTGRRERSCSLGPSRRKDVSGRHQPDGSYDLLGAFRPPSSGRVQMGADEGDTAAPGFLSRTVGEWEDVRIESTLRRYRFNRRGGSDPASSILVPDRCTGFFPKSALLG